MTKETDYLIQSLFEKESLEEITLDEFRRIADQYPFSSIIQFLYSCKLKSLYHLDFPEQVTHTALFFSSPQWLHYQLSDESEKGDFRLSQYDRHFNNVSEDEPIELPVTEFIDEDDTTWENSLSETEVDFLEEKPVFTAPIEEPISVSPEQTPAEVNLPIPIEPYHTVDYFASQGIKTRLDDAQDELGRKVKTFTAWLKTMKRLQPAAEINEIEESDEEIDNGLDQPIMQEIIATEAMAEVYLKQGLAQKAIEVYAKLSLQNPANSHIFAAKIIQIKENSI
ncbi:MAG: hypothetical protein RLZZ520_223 [Bacteroidota bacterium]|jgi:hypothetical protein